MTSRRLVLLAVVVATVAVWVVVASGGGDGAGDGGRQAAPPVARPTRLLDVPAAEALSVEVRDPATGRHALLEGDGASFTVLEGADVDAAELQALRQDLAPLLAVRTFAARAREFGLAEPLLEVLVRTGDTEQRLAIGAPNFDGTAFYAAVGDRTATILPRVVTTLAALVGAAVPAQPTP